MARQSDKVRSFSQFDSGAGTAASRKPRKRRKSTAPATTTTSKARSSKPSGKEITDKLNRDRKEHRRSVLQMGLGKRRNQGAPGAGEGTHG